MILDLTDLYAASNVEHTASNYIPILYVAQVIFLFLIYESTSTLSMKAFNQTYYCLPIFHRWISQ